MQQIEKIFTSDAMQLLFQYWGEDEMPKDQEEIKGWIRNVANPYLRKINNSIIFKIKIDSGMLTIDCYEKI